MSYSQIREKISVSKSTLSNWLKSMPLSEKRIRELRDFSPMRIERCRNTKIYKRQARLDSVYERVSKDIGILSDREIFLVGFFLYWGEGWKTTRTTMALTNTNPQMIKYFMKWINILGIERKRVRVSLQLYSDMDIDKEISFWVKELQVLRSQFRRPYVKKSRLSDITYKTGFGHGTCSVIIQNRDISEYVLMGVKRLGDTMSSE